MKVSKYLAVAFVAMLLCGAASVRADQVDNPQYQAWAKFAVGSSETLAGEIDAQGMKIQMTTVRKLVEKADDHVTVESTTTTSVMGQDRTGPTTKIEIPAKTDAKDVIAHDNEKVEAAGKTYDCKVYETAQPTPQSDQAKAKIWVNGDIPGGLVKMEAGSARGTITYLLKSFEVKS